MPTPSGKRTTKIVLSAAFLGLAAAGTAACGEEEKPQPLTDNGSQAKEQDYKFYCTDADGKVVDEDACDGDDGSSIGAGYFFYMLPYNHTTAYAPGQKIPATVGAPRIAATDVKARTAWGLPATGRVTNGTVKTGIIGAAGGAPVGKAGGGSAPGSGAKGGAVTGKGGGS